MARATATESRAAGSTRVRPERVDDRAAIRRVHDAAFDQPNEGALVDALRATPHWRPTCSIVAERDGAIVGHCLLSGVAIRAEDGALDEDGVLALGPMAVQPALQRQGIGSALVHASLDAARALGARVVIVLGHAEFYPRFGFTPARAQGLLPPWPDLADEVWMALRLRDDVPSPDGTVAYPAPWPDV